MGRPRSATVRRGLAVVLAAVVVAAGCSSTSSGPSGAPRATFSRAEGDSLLYEEPVANVADLQRPLSDDAPWTIVGSIFDPEQGTSMAATWESEDGQSWERRELAPNDPGVSEALSAITATDAGRLAVGWVGDGAASDAAVWTEREGEWVHGDFTELGGEHEQWAFDVAASDTGILVAGGENVWGEVRARLWFSADGESWESVDGGPGGPFDATGQESLREIAAVDDGFVAVGSRNVDNDQDALAWYSPDGREWEELDTPTLGGPGRQALLTVADAGNAVVAGGYTTDMAGQGIPVIWRSLDGRTWGEPSAPLGINDDSRTNTADMTVRTLSVDEEGLVASGGSDWRPHLWRSLDGGISWMTYPNPVGRGLFLDGVALVGAAKRGATTVALGLEPTVMRVQEGDRRWQDATGDAFPTGGEQFFANAAASSDDARVVVGGRYTAPRGDSRERYVGQVWMQRDGDWRPVNSDHLTAGQVMDVTAFEGGFAAVGFEDFGVARRRTVGDSAPDGLIWTSPDGSRWDRIAAESPTADPELMPLLAETGADNAELPLVIARMEAELPRQTQAPAGGDGTRSLGAVAPLGDGFIAVGVACCQDPGEPIVVVSPDGTTITGEDPRFGGPGSQRLRDVCVSPDGEAVAVGVSGTEGNFDIAIRHRATDATWSEGTVEDESFTGDGNQQAFGCAASEDGFVVVGSDDRSGDSDARVWTSEDGISWTRVRSGLLGGSGDQWSRAAAAVPGGGWLVGGSDTAGGDGDIALWRLTASGSVDRRDRGEPELSGPGEQSVDGLTVDGDGVLIVGEDYGRVGVWQSDTVDR